jgi:hypothetical protein
MGLKRKRANPVRAVAVRLEKAAGAVNGERF